MMIKELTNTPATVAQLIEIAQCGLELSDEQVAKALDYEQPGLVKMLKQGTVRLPITKVSKLAEVLQIKPSMLMPMVLREISPQLLQVIEACYDPFKLSDAEVRLIQAIRKSAGGKNSGTVMFDKEAFVALIVTAPTA